MPLTAIVYAPPLAVGDDRPSAVVAALERTVPRVRLDYEITRQLTTSQLPDRDHRLREAAHRREFPFLWSGDEARYVSVCGAELPQILGPGSASLDIHVTLSDAEAERADTVLGAVGDAARAWWGGCSPLKTAGTIGAQTVHAHLPQAPPLALPGLRPRHQLSHPWVPQSLAWINYWSAPAADHIGFPDPSRDAELLQRAHRTADEAWVVQLVAEPLDLARPDHLAALQAAYRRFPAIGDRGSIES